MWIFGHSSKIHHQNPLSLLPLYPLTSLLVGIHFRECMLLVQAGSHGLISAFLFRVIKYLEDSHFTASLDPCCRCLGTLRLIISVSVASHKLPFQFLTMGHLTSLKV